MDRKVKKNKNQRYYCSECERDIIEHKPLSSNQNELRRRCRVCRKECTFLPLDEEW